MDWAHQGEGDLKEGAPGGEPVGQVQQAGISLVTMQNNGIVRRNGTENHGIFSIWEAQHPGCLKTKGFDNFGEPAQLPPSWEGPSSM